MTASILTSSEMAAAAISMTSASTSKTGGCHLHVIGELFEDPPVLAAQRKVDRFDLQEVVTSLKLGSGEG